MAISYVGTYINVCVYIYMCMYDIIIWWLPYENHITCLNGSLRGICNKSCLMLRNATTFICQINVRLLIHILCEYRRR